MKTTDKLRQLFANLWILFFDSRNAHWNIQSQNFMELHKFFESLYQLSEDYADDIAERIRQLGEFTPILISEILRLKTVTDVAEILSDETTAINHLLGKDEASRNLLAGMTQELEKRMWFLRSFK